MRMVFLGLTGLALILGSIQGYSEAWLWMVLGVLVISLCAKRLQYAHGPQSWMLSLTISAVLAMMIWW